MSDTSVQIAPREAPLYTPRDLVVSEDTAQAMKDAVSPSTQRAYAYDLQTYKDWCRRVERVAIPATPQTFAEYVQALATAGLAPKSIQRAFGAIRTAHRTEGYEPPDGKGASLVIRSHRKKRADDKMRDRKASPIMMDALRKMVAVCDPNEPAGIRDRALIVLGFTLMARRSELANLDDADLDRDDDGLQVLIRWSKTDQDAIGCVVPVPFGEHPETCPVRLVSAWQDVLVGRGLRLGPLWRGVDRYGRVSGERGYAGPPAHRMTDAAVRLVVRRVARQAGVTGNISAHSLRSGGASEAYLKGKDPLLIARHGRWKDGSPVLLGYIRNIQQRENNPMKDIGL